MKIRDITLISILSTLSVVGRISLSSLPNIQPTTFIIISISFVFGPFYGVMVAFISAIVSNMVLGSGIWTVGQIIAWSFIGLISGLIGKYYKKIPKILLVGYYALMGYVFGFLMSLWTILLSPIAFWTYYLSGLPFDTAHAISNVAFSIVCGNIFIKLLENQKNKYSLRD